MRLCEQLRVVRRERLRQLLLKPPAEVPQHPRLGFVPYGELVRIGEATGELEEHKGLISTQLKVNGLLRLMAHTRGYDFKQGFLRLDGKNTFDDESFDKILKTLVGIANIRKGVRGYVLVGVADTSADAQRVTKLYGVNPTPFDRFFITGVEHEAVALAKSLDDLFMDLAAKIKASALSEPLRDYVARNVKSVRYYDKTIFVFETQAQAEPSNFGGAFFVRHGNQLAEVPAAQYGELFKRFIAGM